MNWKVRIKNPYFWIGLVGVILTAMGIDAEMLTSWVLVKEAVIDLVSNPFMIGSVFVAVLGVFVDPTTASIGDSDLAMSYTKPKRN